MLKSMVLLYGTIISSSEMVYGKRLNVLFVRIDPPVKLFPATSIILPLINGIFSIALCWKSTRYLQLQCIASIYERWKFKVIPLTVGNGKIIYGSGVKIGSSKSTTMSDDDICIALFMDGGILSNAVTVTFSNALPARSVIIGADGFVVLNTICGVALDFSELKSEISSVVSFRMLNSSIYALVASYNAGLQIVKISSITAIPDKTAPKHNLICNHKPTSDFSRL